MSRSTPTDPELPGESSARREPPPPRYPEEIEYDASLFVDEPDDEPYSQSDRDYFADEAADRYERWLDQR